MKRWLLFISWLAIAAVVEWLIGRTITRSAIFMPKSPLFITVYQALGTIGQVTFTLTSLLALIGMVGIVWQERRQRLFAFLFGVSIVLSLIFIVVAPTDWWAVLNWAWLMVIVAALIGRLWFTTAEWPWKIALTLPALAMWVGALYHLLPALAQALHLPETSALAPGLFNLGEALVVLSPIGLWWVLRSQVRSRAYLIAAVPALAFSIVHAVNPAMTSMIAIWSIGLTFYLPGLIYAVSLWLCGAVILSTVRRDQPIGWALLLLLAGGYAPQVSTHVFLCLIALWLMILITVNVPRTVREAGNEVPENLQIEPAAA